MLGKCKAFTILVMALLLLLTSCSAAQASYLSICGAGDMLAAAGALKQLYIENEKAEITVQRSYNCIDDLKSGRCSIALLGREPLAAEIEGLHDTVIAMDAICIIVDENSYVGGEWTQGKGLGLSWGFSGERTSGLRELSVSESKALFDFYLLKPSKRWDWPNYCYATNGEWTYSSRQLSMQFGFLPGRFDTQSALYQALGLDENEIIGAIGNFIHERFGTEEEVLAFEYKPGNPYTKFSGKYCFKIGFASRRVTQLALKHVPVRVIRIDGINPMTQTDCIYDGSYPFTRRIHLLVRQQDIHTLQSLIDLAQSPAGQQALVNAGYLALENTR